MGQEQKCCVTGVAVLSGSEDMLKARSSAGRAAHLLLQVRRLVQAPREPKWPRTSTAFLARGRNQAGKQPEALISSAQAVCYPYREVLFFFFLRNCCFAALFLFFFISFPSKHQFCLGEGSEGAKATGLELRPCQEEWQSPGGPAMPSLRATSSPRPSPQLV